MKDVEFFCATDNGKTNVVNQKTKRQKIRIDLKKSIRGVARRDLKKGDGSVVTLFNNIVEQKNDEMSIPLYSFYERI
jgi:adenine specific DNA methylase Mod